jgi:hypothetical protein
MSSTRPLSANDLNWDPPSVGCLTDEELLLLASVPGRDGSSSLARDH